MATRPETAHLLRRAGFGGTPEEIDALAPRSRAALVTAVTAIRDRTPAAPPELSDPVLDEYEKMSACTKWWLDRMIRSSFTDTTTPSPLVEKMTLFWHNHFANSWDKVFRTRWLHHQNGLFRVHGLGSFRTLCRAVSVSPSMLIYLDNETNTKDAPNQNFARELMELFMLGIGNYTEADVIAGAAAWSGHTIRYGGAPDYLPLGYRFDADQHDTESRTFLGQTKVWSGPDTIDWILDSPVTGPICAKFLCRKLWTWLAAPNPPQNVVDDLAAVMIANNWSILLTVRALFNRPEFWDVATTNGLVRTPVEFAAATGKALKLTGASMNPQWSLDGMGQVLFRPPNVSGWRPNEYWIATSAMSSRADIGRMWTSVSLDELNPTLFVDIIDDNLPPSQRLPVPDVVQAMLARFSIVDPTPELVQTLTDWCIENRHEWTEAEPFNYWGERTHIIQHILISRDYQLN
jgi:uncharacterized protein (DUF1800 family)